MHISDILFGWLFFSFYRLWSPIIATVGFGTPLTVVIITSHNTIAVCYLLLLTAIGCLALRRRGWILALATNLTWILIGLLFLGVHSQFYGLAYSLASTFTHGWLEFYAIFYWIYKLQRACKNCHLNFKDEWLSWTDCFRAAKNPLKLLNLIVGDAKIAWNQTSLIVGELWRQNMKCDLLSVIFLIFVSAVVETYITPVLASPFKT